MPEAQVRTDWNVSFTIDYSKGYPELKWGQNRQPFVDEMMTFLAQLQVRAFRLSSVMAQIEDRVLAANPDQIEKPKLVVASGNGTNGG